MSRDLSASPFATSAVLKVSRVIHVAFETYSISYTRVQSLFIVNIVNKPVPAFIHQHGASSSNDGNMYILRAGLC